MTPTPTPRTIKDDNRRLNFKDELEKKLTDATASPTMTVHQKRVDIINNELVKIFIQTNKGSELDELIAQMKEDIEKAL